MSEDQPIFAISDLHIGDGGPRDNFGYRGSDRPKQLERLLDHVEAEGGKLFVVGDLLEFWQASFSKVIVHNLPLLDRLATLKATYVLGNHDADLLHFIGKDLLTHPLLASMTQPVTRSIGGKIFKFMHGHEVDPFNAGDTPSWGRMMAIFAGICEDKAGSPMLGTEPLEGLLARLGEWLLKKAANLRAADRASVIKSTRSELTPAQNPSRAADMLGKYAADRETGGYDVAIVGHTHQPGRIGDWYFNTGSWATSNNNFVRIEPDGRVAVYDWVDGQAVANETVLKMPPA